MRPISAAPALAAVLALLAFATGSAGATASPAGAPAQVPTDQIIVRPAERSLPDSASLAATAGEPVQQSRRLADGAYVLKLSGRRSPEKLAKIIERLAARGDIASAEPDALLLPLATPNDPRYGDQWHYFAPSSGFFGANLPGAWDLTTGSSSVVVGVIDTGYRPHADLAGRFVSGYDFIGDAFVANDGGGRDADASDPGDWISTTENATGYFAGCGVRNSSWHGTHVSGTIGAATNNGVGVAGINRVSKIQPLRVLGKCGGYTSDIADAIRWGAGLSVSGVARECHALGRRQPEPRRRRQLLVHDAVGDRRGGLGRDDSGRRRGEQQRRRFGVLPGQLQQCDHRRRDGAHGGACVLLELRRDGRARGAGWRRPARQDGALDPQRRAHHARARTATRTTRARAWRPRTWRASPRCSCPSILRSRPRRSRPAANDGDAVPGREQLHDRAVRHRHRERRCGGGAGSRRGRPHPTGGVREDDPGERRHGAAGVGVPLVGHERGCRAIRVLHRRDRQRLVRRLVGLDSGDERRRLHPALRHDLPVAGPGEQRRWDDALRRRVVVELHHDRHRHGAGSVLQARPDERSSTGSAPRSRSPGR